MAESVPSLSEELSCSICAEIFLDPVQLPCQHNFCRRCITTYAENSTDSILTCPHCRKSSGVQRLQITDIPSNFVVTNIVNSYHNQLSTRKVCIVCDTDSPKPAVKACPVCKLLYCKECLNVVHPMKGALAKHILVDAQSYVAIPECQLHDMPLEMYCQDCKYLICFLCDRTGGHREHEVNDTKSAFSDEMVLLKEKKYQLQKAADDISSGISRLKTEDEVIKRCSREDHTKAREKYQRMLAALDAWLCGTLETIDERRDSLLGRTHVEREDLHKRLSVIENYLEKKKEYFERDPVLFLMESEETKKRFDAEIVTASDSLGSYKSRLAEIQAHEGNQPITTNKLCLTEQLGDDESLIVHRNEDGCTEFRHRELTVLCPKFAMEKELHDCVSVTDDGKMLTNTRQCDNAKCTCGALANRSLNEGKVYWEMDTTFTVKKKMDRNLLVYSAGILRKTKELPLYAGLNAHSWGVTIAQISTLEFDCWHAGNDVFTLPVFGSDQVNGGTVRQGFYLDCDNKTLTILDRTRDRVLHTFTGLDLSEPLTPTVSAHNFNRVSVSVRLRSGHDISTIPTCLLSETFYQKRDRTDRLGTVLPSSLTRSQEAHISAPASK